MYRLIYVSRSVTRFPTDLKVILESSRRNNATFEITGALCFLDGVWCQYLEGEKIALENLFQILLSDPRHKDVKLVEMCSITQRLFADWTMALVTWNKQTHALFKTLNPVDTVDLYAITTANAAVMFYGLSQSSSWMALTPNSQL